MDDVGRWHDSELPSLGGQLDHNDPGLQLEEFTSRFQCKKTGSEAAGHHKTTGPPNALARRTRQRPRATESSPRAGSRQPRLTDCSAAAAPPPRPSAGETTSWAGPRPPNGPDAGLGLMPHHSDRRGQLDPRAARRSRTTARAAWLTRNGLAAHLTASHGPGPPRHQHRTPTRTGPTTTGPRSTWTRSCDARLGSDSCTNATHKGTRPLRARDHWHPSVFISEPPGPPLAGPKHLVYLGPHRASCGTTHHEPNRYPLPGFSSFPQ